MFPSDDKPDVLDLLSTLLASLDQGFCLCEAIVDDEGRPVDYRVLAVNDLFETMSGLKDATGRRALELVPDLEPFWIETYCRVGLTRRAERFVNRSEPMGRWFDVYAAPFDHAPRFIVIFRDITRERLLAEEREAARDRAEALLQELNHRVMNSLGMIAAIIGLEARSRDDGEGRRALERIGDRVHAVADLYRTLSTAHFATEVRADEYLGEVVDRLSASLANGRIELRAEIDPVLLPTHVAAPLGLAVNELVTNSLKYAFGEDERGTVRVIFQCHGKMGRLIVADGGRGIGDAQPSGGVGRKLVGAFVQQLGGTMDTEARDGTIVTLDFPLDTPRT